MRPFNLEEAKAGKPVCTRDGRDVRIICFDRKNIINCPIVALIPKSSYEDVRLYSLEGVGFDSDEKLFMKSEKKTGWINIYKDNIRGNHIFNTKEEALFNKDLNYIDTIKIEWEK